MTTFAIVTQIKIKYCLNPLSVIKSLAALAGYNL